MNSTSRNVLGFLLAAFVGMLVNGFIISISSKLIPLPEGINPENMESLKKNMHLFESKHFLMPFLAHALGTLAGAIIVVKTATSYHLIQALGIGALFLIGGTIMVFSVPSPIWFSILDIGLAYLPMSWLGYKIIK